MKSILSHFVIVLGPLFWSKSQRRNRFYYKINFPYSLKNITTPPNFNNNLSSKSKRFFTIWFNISPVRWFFWKTILHGKKDIAGRVKLWSRIPYYEWNVQLEDSVSSVFGGVEVKFNLSNWWEETGGYDRTSAHAPCRARPPAWSPTSSIFIELYLQTAGAGAAQLARSNDVFWMLFRRHSS